MSVKLTRIYTKTGDQGETSLVSGARVPKDSLRVQTIGDIDEANACLGLAVLHGDERLQHILTTIQNDLFDLGADIATPEDSLRQESLRIVETQVGALEKLIDRFNDEMEPLSSFILPGGSALSAHLHLVRAVVRRAERSAVSLGLKESVNPFALQYLNRLSDLLFVLARHGNDNGAKDRLWKPGGSRNITWD